MKPLHPVVTPLDTFRILVVHHFRMTNLTDHHAASKIYQFVDVERGVFLFAKGADVAFVI